MQEGYDPNDLTMTADEFVLGRSGKWLSLSHFFKLPVPERRAEFVFGTAAEVMQMMSNLPSKVQMLQRPEAEPEGAATTAGIPAGDEMAAALRAQQKPGGSASPS